MGCLLLCELWNPWSLFSGQKMWEEAPGPAYTASGADAGHDCPHLAASYLFQVLARIKERPSWNECHR